MEFIIVRDLCTRSGQIWDKLRQQHDLILTSNGKPIAVLSGIGEGGVEETLASLRRARDLHSSTTVGSRDRSVAVLKYLAQSDLLHLDRMSAVGYGSDRPAVPNRDETTRALNRRVDFVLKLNDLTESPRNGDSPIPL